MSTSIRVLFLGSFLLSLIAGCGSTRVVGARALLPLQTQDASRVWVYMDTDDSHRNGVYRCIDEGGQVVCMKAQLH
ncbi:MAG TPA: hypothetical protein ENK57_23095 [Polyangiaceae bacterium]|nr:hypothetical protein [Polyangiaceae bacterium]